MEVTIQVPEDIAYHLQAKWGQDLPRHVLESVALECFRERILGEGHLRRLLEAVWKQSLYTRRGDVIYRARLRTDLLDNRSLDMLLEISKKLIY